MKNLLVSVRDLKPGQMRKGPDYYKSCCSGYAPVIYRDKGGQYPYIVCRIGDLEKAKMLNNQTEPIRSKHHGTTIRKIGLYATRKRAFAGFLAMCEAILEINRGLHDRCMNQAMVQAV